jgi:signal transduction histidine kinase
VKILKFWGLSFISIFWIQPLYSVNDSIISLLPDTFDSNNPSHYIDLASRYETNGNLELAKYLIDEGVKKGQKESNKQLEVTLTYYLADYYYYKQDYKQAGELYQKILHDFEEIHDTLMIAKTLNSIGLIYSFQNDNENTIKFYIRDFELLEKVKMTSRKLEIEKIIVLTNIINLYRATKHYRQVIEKAPMAISLAGELGDSVRLASNLNSLGMAYKNLNEIDKSLETFLRAISIFEKLGDEFRKAFVLLNIGELYDYTHQMDSSYKYFNLALNMFRANSYVYGILWAQNDIGMIYIKSRKFDLARKLYNNNIDSGRNYRFNDILLEAYSRMASLEYETGNYKKAYDYKNLYNKLNDSLFTIEKDLQYAELQTKFETIQKENEINLLKSEKLIRNNELRRNRYFVWIGFSIIIILLAAFYIGTIFYNQKRKANKLLTEKNIQIELKNEQLGNMNQHISQMNELLQISQIELTNANNSKNRFFSILAHDLRNPFHTIIGQSYLLSKSYVRLSPEERRKYASDILCSCEQVNRLLENLLEWARTQTKSIEFKPQQVDFYQLVLNSLSVLKNNADEKKIVIENSIDNTILLNADPQMLETIVRNMVNNSIKFTKQGGIITLSAIVENNNLITSISDTGVGIEKCNLEQLFQIDSNVKTRGTNYENGTGLGLVICKEFIDFHKGEIWAESTPGKGSVFHFSIPLA